MAACAAVPRDGHEHWDARRAARRAAARPGPVGRGRGERPDGSSRNSSGPDGRWPAAQSAGRRRSCRIAVGTWRWRNHGSLLRFVMPRRWPRQLRGRGIPGIATDAEPSGRRTVLRAARGQPAARLAASNVTRAAWRSKPSCAWRLPPRSTAGPGAAPAARHSSAAAHALGSSTVPSAAPSMTPAAARVPSAKLAYMWCESRPSSACGCRQYGLPTCRRGRRGCARRARRAATAPLRCRRRPTSTRATPGWRRSCPTRCTTGSSRGRHARAAPHPVRGSSAHTSPRQSNSGPYTT